jgi:hypothetical protein
VEAVYRARSSVTSIGGLTRMLAALAREQELAPLLVCRFES